MIDAYPKLIRADASAFIVFRGPPNTEIEWILTGSGTLTEADTHTDQFGLAKAVLHPSTGDQDMIVEVEYVA
jgi:hypothetical protein